MGIPEMVPDFGTDWRNGKIGRRPKPDKHFKGNKGLAPLSNIPLFQSIFSCWYYTIFHEKEKARSPGVYNPLKILYNI
jgi:hypothetical protein